MLFCTLQAIIIDTDNQSTFTVQTMPGYAPPTDIGTRIMFYDPQGNLYPMYQVRTSIPYGF